MPFSRGGPLGPDDEYRTPLEMAVDLPENTPRALKNKLARIDKLLAKGAETNNKDLNVALVRACYGSSPAVITRLLAAGADVNARLDAKAYLGGQSALIRASYNHDPAIARLLLDAGADPNVKTPRSGYGESDGDSALIVAARVGNLEMVKLLLDHGAEANYRYSCTSECGTALISAITGHDYETRQGTGEGIPAIDTRYEMIVKLLLEHGADANLAVGYQSSPDAPLPHTPLVVALDKSGSAFVPLLLDHGAQVNVQSDGTWPLIVAVHNGDFHSLGLLLARGADVRALNKQGHNALVAAFRCYACRDKKLDMIEQLLASGAPVNAKNGGLANTLIEAIDGARRTVNASFSIPKERLREKETKIFLRLIELGADLDTVNMDGNTALSMAREDKYTTVVNEIERRMAAAKHSQTGNLSAP